MLCMQLTWITRPQSWPANNVDQLWIQSVGSSEDSSLGIAIGLRSVKGTCEQSIPGHANIRGMVLNISKPPELPNSFVDCDRLYFRSKTKYWTCIHMDYFCSTQLL